MEIVDLHVHTTASDGALAPREVVQRARQLGIKAIAITDHDTLQGIQEALEEGRKSGVEVVPGVELSVDFPRGTCHLLGYFVDPQNGKLRKILSIVQRSREERNYKMLEKLKALGFELTMDEVKSFSKDGQICRPHFALAMVKRGYVTSVEEAFDRYLKKGGPAYVEKFKLSPGRALRAICEARGISVLAHPYTLEMSEEELKVFIGKLKELGLQGIEVYYPDHTPQQVALYLALAREFDLVPTGGTDFHGPTVKEDIELGRGKGDLLLPYELLEGLKKRLS